MTLDDFTTQLQSMFDISSAQAQGYIQEAYRQFVTDTEWLTATITLATTVGGQAAYPLPSTVMNVRSLLVDGVEYMRAGEWDIPQLAAGTAYLPRGTTGAFAQTSGADGSDEIVLFPTPTSSGSVVSGKVEQIPADLVPGAGAGASPVVSLDLHPAILNKAIATAYLRDSELGYMSQYYDGLYQEAVQKGKGRKKSRVSGHGPFRVRVQNYDFNL